MEITFNWDGTLSLTEPASTFAEKSAIGPRWGSKRTPTPKLRTTTFQGLPIVIENEAGSVRSGKKPDGTPWSTVMTHAYGYIARTSGIDQDGIDVFLGPNESSDRVHIVRIKEPSLGGLDEHKVFLGFDEPEDVKRVFQNNYDNPNYFEAQEEMSMKDFLHFIGWAAIPDLQLDDKPPTPTIYMVRHAHSEDNGDPNDPSTQRVRGSRDVQPDAQGIAEAERIGQEFIGIRVDKIYTSGKRRARIVADAISRATGAPVEIDPSAESWNRGELEGCQVSSVMELMRHYADNPDEVPPGGESRNAWLAKFGTDLHAKMNETETKRIAIVYVTHLSNIMAVPAVVENDPDLLPFPSVKFRTCEMLALTKPGKEWKWKRYVHLADRLNPIDQGSHRAILDRVSHQLHLLLRDAAPGTQLMAADYIRKVSHVPDRLDDLNALVCGDSLIDAQLAARIAGCIVPAFTYGHDAVLQEYNKFQVLPVDNPWQDPPTGGFQPNNYPAPAINQPDVWPPPVGSRVENATPSPVLQSPWAPAVTALGKRAAFDFAQWTLSREMSQLPDDSFPVELAAADDPNEFNLEADMLQNAIGAAGLPLAQLSREIAHTAMNMGRKRGIKELQSHVQKVTLKQGIVAAEFAE